MVYNLQRDDSDRPAQLLRIIIALSVRLKNYTTGTKSHDTKLFGCSMPTVNKSFGTYRANLPVKKHLGGSYDRLNGFCHAEVFQTFY